MKHHTNINAVEREKFEDIYIWHLHNNPGEVEWIVLGSKIVLFTRTLLVVM